jgi:hypothetical protein
VSSYRHKHASKQRTCTNVHPTLTLTLTLTVCLTVTHMITLTPTQKPHLRKSHCQHNCESKEVIAHTWYPITEAARTHLLSPTLLLDTL